jgi:glycosyltransferase involved in cell wall biosynthesis
VKPLVSILIPAYNAERWIADTIQSALAQTWPRKEIIIVDDGSRDGTAAIARRFASKTVSVISQQNQGASTARNRAVELCQGHYIQWLDADDLLSADKIAIQMAVAQECEDKRILLSSGWAYFMYRPSKARFIPTSLWCDLSPVEWLVRKWEDNAHMQTATWLVSRELTQATGPWDTRLLNNDDGEYFCRVLGASNGVRFVPDARVFYRQVGSNCLSYIGRSNKKIEAHFLGMRLQISSLLSLEDSERVRAACLRHLRNCFVYFYPERPDIVQELQQLAVRLGGHLSLPDGAPWKFCRPPGLPGLTRYKVSFEDFTYALIRKLFGFAAAKRTQLYYNFGKLSALTAWDKIMHSVERLDRRSAKTIG